MEDEEEQQGRNKGSQSLQTQLAHLFQHHQQNSAHSPYIDFQNVLYAYPPDTPRHHEHHHQELHRNHDRNHNLLHHKSDNRRQSFTSLTMGEALAKSRSEANNITLHLDMDMQLDSVIVSAGGGGGSGGGGGGSGGGGSIGGGSIGGGSTLTEFTKRRNWSQRIIEELQDLLCILTPSGKIRYTSPNTKHITGYSAEELLGRMITDFVHIDDSHIFIREFNESIASTHPLRLFFRFRRKDSSYAIFESNGHPHFSDQRHLSSSSSSNTTTTTTSSVCSGFFMMARLYPTKNVALLDSFLEHKIENERLKRRIAELRLEEQEEQAAQARARTEAAAAVAVALATEAAADNNPPTVSTALSSNHSKSMPPPATPGQLTRQNLEGLNSSALRSDSLRDKMARYEGVTHADTIEMLTGLRYNEGERSRGISTGDTSPSLIRGDAGVPMSADRESRGSGERKKKVKITNEYVCTDCGTLDSPEWRKGPTGPKTLCNACGLRWAKKEKKRNSVSGPSQSQSQSQSRAPPLGGPVPPVPSLAQNYN